LNPEIIDSLISKAKFNKSSLMKLHLFHRKDKKTHMSALLKDRLEQQLRTRLLRVEKEVDQAIPEKQDEALQHYQEALSLFGRLVLSRQLSGEAGASGAESSEVNRQPWHECPPDKRASLKEAFLHFGMLDP
jgi:hypothetical protein